MKLKIILTLLLQFTALSVIYSQSESLPYFIGFDNPADTTGWQQFRTGVLSMSDWGVGTNLYHDYNVGGNASDTVIDWFVSPPINFSTSSLLTFKVTAFGFSTPTPDNCEIWLGTGSPNPSIGNFTLFANLSYLQPQSQWIDTALNISLISDSGYIAFKYKTVGATWMTYGIDSFSINSTVDIYDQDITSLSIINICPNPLIRSTTLKFNSTVHSGTLIVYNMDGQRVRTVNNILGQEYDFTRDNLKNGLYLIRLTEGGKTLATNKLIITGR